MAVNIPASGGDDEEVLATINTTPLVDVMLVMLIIFLITIPVVITVIPVNLPKAIDKATQTKPIDISLAIDANGKIFWGVQPVETIQDLSNRLNAAVRQSIAEGRDPPQLHIRADKDTMFQNVGRVIFVAQQNSIMKMAFIIEPPPNP
jgi:biopolymer transport protein ExbD